MGYNEAGRKKRIYLMVVVKTLFLGSMLVFGFACSSSKRISENRSETPENPDLTQPSPSSSLPSPIEESISTFSAIDFFSSENVDIAPPAIDLNDLTKDFLTSDFVRSPGDINCDGVIGKRDLEYLVASWATPKPVADLNLDGVVDFRDLTQLLGSYNASESNLESGKGILIADLNLDCAVDLEDLSLLVEAFGEDPYDLTGDQIVNRLDIAVLISQWGAGVRREGLRLSDFNLDGRVNMYDLTQILGSWSTARGDLDNDELTDHADLKLHLAHWDTHLIESFENFDVNKDRQINEFDLYIVLSAVGSSFRLADLNADGVVSLEDVNILKNILSSI